MRRLSTVPLPEYALVFMLVHIAVYSFYQLRHGLQQSDRKVQVDHATCNVHEHDACPNANRTRKPALEFQTIDIKQIEDASEAAT